MKSDKRNITLKASAVFVTALPCYVMFSNYYDLINSSGIFLHLSSLGFALISVFVPYSLIILSDSFGWRLAFGKKTEQISVKKLFLIRLASETLQTSLPGGAVYAELIRPYLIKKHFNIEYRETITANIITKINILVAQVIFFACGIMILLFSFRNNISSLFPSKYIFYSAVVVFLTIPFLLAYLFYRRNLLMHLIHFFEKIKLRKFKNIVDKIRQPAYEINRTVFLFSHNYKKRLFLTVSFFFLTWFLMSVESLVILKVIGIDAGISQVILLESFISFVRILFFFIPGALGPQDAAIILLFNLSGLPDPVTNAFLFSLLKRSKELLWIITGYILLIFLGVRPYKLIRSKQVDFATES